MKVTVLGSGTPMPLVERAGAGFLIHLPDRLIQVDAGIGCVRRQLEAGVAPHDITQLYITHLHTDHIVEFGSFVMAGLTWDHEGNCLERERLDVFGPPGTKRLAATLFENLYADDVEYRLDEGGFAGTSITRMNVQEVWPGIIVDENDLTVTAAEALHTFHDVAYRFDYLGRSVVLTGDTAPTERVTNLAKGANVLFHDSSLGPVVRTLVRDPKRWDAARRGEHSTPEDAGQVAEDAGVEKLVLIHVYPFDDPDELVKAASSRFSGEVVVAQDLAEIPV